MSFLEETELLEPKKTHSLWVERYRPTTLSDYVGNDTLKSKVEQYISSNDIPHLLLYGSAGTGKCLDFSEKINIKIKLTEKEAKLLKKWIVS
jgi:replication-associated recombination protein RarA